MTKRQQAILESAQILFLERGYYGTTTKAIASHAQVSEALLFKHFKNKEGLLNALLSHAEKEVLSRLHKLSGIEDSKLIIKQIISLPFEQFRKKEYVFALLSKLKSHNHVALDYLQILSKTLLSAFEAQLYKAPQLECDLTVLLIEQLSISLSAERINNVDELEQYIMRKYGVDSE